MLTVDHYMWEKKQEICFMYMYDKDFQMNL